MGPQVRQQARAAAEEWTLRGAPRPGVEGVGHFCLDSQDRCLWRAQVYVQTSEALNLGWRRNSVSPHGCPGFCGASVRTLGQFPTRRQVKGALAWGTWRAKLPRPQDKREGGDKQKLGWLPSQAPSQHSREVPHVGAQAGQGA